MLLGSCIHINDEPGGFVEAGGAYLNTESDPVGGGVVAEKGVDGGVV